MIKQDSVAWVFISHASADLEKVRHVRNFMEERGAGPLLFYLRSLTEPEKFWPIIEQEIAARNFFLLCDSAAARASQWVQREREAVAKIAQQRPVRIGRVSLEDTEIDFAGLASYLLNVGVYVVHPRDSVSYEAIWAVLGRFGYAALGGMGTTAQGIAHLIGDSMAAEDTRANMAYSANQGWLLVVMNREMATAPNFFSALPRRAGDHVMFVLTEPCPVAHLDPAYVVDASASLEQGLVVAARKMLTA